MIHRLRMHNIIPYKASWFANRLYITVLSSCHFYACQTFFALQDLEKYDGNNVNDNAIFPPFLVSVPKFCFLNNNNERKQKVSKKIFYKTPDYVEHKMLQVILC